MFKKALILAPHTDDGELGCGGTIHKMIQEGTEVLYIAFSSCEESVPEGFPLDVLVHEMKEATKRLGIKSDNVRVLDFKVRKFASTRQEILEELVKVRRSYDPDVVFMPSTHDTHQDHEVITNEGIRAFKHSTILGYEMPWNNLSFSYDTFVGLTKEDVDAKVHALQAYQSQEGIRNYSNENFIRSLATVRGTQIQMQFAEVFESVRQVIR